MKTINVGVIGMGMIGPIHVEALRRLGYVNVVAIADVDQASVDRKNEQLCVPKAYGNYHDLIADPEVEVVHVCTPNFLHHEMVMEALNAGKHVVCDKPLAMNVAQGTELYELAKSKGLVAALNFNVRYYPLIHEVKAMIEAGELGRVLAVTGSYTQDWLLKETDYSWRLEPDKSGESRAVADIGSHWMDAVEFMLGERVSKVFADFAIFHPTRKKPLKPVETYSGKILTPEDYEEVPIVTEDYAAVLFHCENGAHGHMTVNQAAAGCKNRIFFEINGTKRSVRFDSERPNDLWIGERDTLNGALMRDPALLHPSASKLVSYPGGHNEGFPDSFKQCFRQIYDFIRSDGMANNLPVVFPTFEDGVRELQLNEKIVASARGNCWQETL